MPEVPIGRAAASGAAWRDTRAAGPRALVAAAIALVLGCGHRDATSAETTGGARAAPPPTSAAPVPAPEPERAFGGGELAVGSRRLAVGRAWACALTSTRRVACWGRVPWSPSASPSELASLRGAVELVRSSDEGICAIDGRGAARCLDTERRWTIALDADARAIGAARGLVCGVSADGPLHCADADGPVPVPGEPITDALEARSAGRRVCVRRRVGPVTCLERLGPGRAQRDVLLGTEGAIAVGYHRDAACAALADDTIVCARSVVDASARTFATAAREEAPPFAPIAVAGDDYDVCALSEHGEAWCVEHDLSRSRGVVDVALGPSGPMGPLCVIDAGDHVACEGPNDFGESNGVAPTGAVSRVPLEEPAIGLTRSPCALLASGALRCWNDAPAPWVEEAPPFVEIAEDDDLLCGRTARGEVWCRSTWGERRAMRRVARLEASGGLRSGARLVAISARGEVGVLAADDDRVERSPLPALAGASDAVSARANEVCAIVGTQMRCVLQGADLDDLGDAAPRVRATEGVARMLVQDRRVLPVSVSGTLPDGSAAPRGAAGACSWDASGPIRCLDEGEATPREIAEVRDVQTAVGTSDAGCAIVLGGDVWCWGRAARGDGTVRTVQALEPIDLSVLR